MSPGATWGLLIIAAFAMIATFSENSAQKAADAAPLITAVALREFYMTDRNTAETAFTGNLIKVKGEVLYSGGPDLGKYRIGLRAGEGPVGQVVAFLSERHGAFVNGLSKGSEITISGVCGGLTNGIVNIDVR